MQEQHTRARFSRCRAAGSGFNQISRDVASIDSGEPEIGNTNACLEFRRQPPGLNRRLLVSELRRGQLGKRSGCDEQEQVEWK
jgi:hypothetical protein